MGIQYRSHSYGWIPSKEHGRSVTFYDNQSARKTSRICRNTIKRMTRCYIQQCGKHRSRINSQKPHNTSSWWTNYGVSVLTLQWRPNGRDSVLNHQPHDCLLNRLFRRRSKKTSKLRVTGLCVGNSPVAGEFPAQMASNAENVSIWWRHH